MTLKLHATGQSRISSLPSTDRARILSWLMEFSQDQRGDGSRVHRVNSAPGLWTARVTDDYRAVLVQDGSDWIVVYIGRHDDAYRWAEGRKVRVEADAIAIEFTSQSLVEEVAIPGIRAPAEAPTTSLIPDALASDSALAGWGLAQEQIGVLRRIIDTDTLLEFATGLPEAAADKLLRAATGESMESIEPAPAEEDAPVIAGLDVRRTFYIVDGNDDLARVVEKPLAAWVAFLHPSQHRIAYGDFSGPVKVSGGAGTGKTVVALHRARHLARQGRRVLLASYIGTLCENLEDMLKDLCTDDERSMITVSTVHSMASLVARHGGRKFQLDNDGRTERWLKEIADRRDQARTPDWYMMEWEHVVQAQGIRTLEAYLAASRAGRVTPLRQDERQSVWQVFEELFRMLGSDQLTDWASLCMAAREVVESGGFDSPYDAVVCDEMQDLRPQELRFLASMARDQHNGVTLVGDMAQRVFVPKFSLKSAGIDVVGHSFVLKVNYRTTRQIKDLAEAVLCTGPETHDAALSVYSGPSPRLTQFEREVQEAQAVAGAIDKMVSSGAYAPDDIAVFARSGHYLKAVEGQLDEHRVRFCRLSKERPLRGCVRTATMHRAKGLEYKAVFVVGASAEALPEPKAVTGIDDPQAFGEAMERERQLLYVAMTRARDELCVTWVGRPSEFVPAAPASGSRG